MTLEETKRAGRKRQRAKETHPATTGQQKAQVHSVEPQTAAKERKASRCKPKKRARVVHVEVTEAAAKEAKTAKAEHEENASDLRMEALESDDYFEVLGLARGCSDADVRRAYRRLAVQWHPDKNRSHPRAEEYFKKVGEAYAVLSDPGKRSLYETYGRAGLEPGAADGGGSAGSGVYHDPFGFGYGGRAGFSSRHAYDIFESFFRGSDPFTELFGGFGGAPRQRQSTWQQRGGLGVDMDDNVGFGGFGSMGMGFTGGGGGGMAAMMDSFFGDGFGRDTSGSFSSSFGSFGGGGTFSSSVSSSSFTDQHGHVVTKKTTTTVDAAGRAESVTEEFHNGNLVSSTSSTGTSRLAGAGRMQLGGVAASNSASLPPSSATNGDESQSSRRRSASSRSRPRY